MKAQLKLLPHDTTFRIVYMVMENIYRLDGEQTGESYGTFLSWEDARDERKKLEEAKG